MQILAERIAKELARAPHCAIYEQELSRIWPTDDYVNLEANLRKFAAAHGWELRFYKDGLCAIFAPASAEHFFDFE